MQPRFSTEEVAFPGLELPLYRAHVFLPPNCPVKVTTGVLQQQKRLAVQSACLAACKALHKVCA